MIDELGLKGQRIGDAQISEKHGNFIINRGKARARDVLELVEMAQARVHDAFGIDLELEIKALRRR
jgi:UDP-N-acetylmuramate dehydrogenase